MARRKPRFKINAKTVFITVKTIFILTAISLVIGICGIIFFSKSNQTNIVMRVSILILSIINILGSIFVQGGFIWFTLEDKESFRQAFKGRYSSKDDLFYIVFSIVVITLIILTLIIISMVL